MAQGLAFENHDLLQFVPFPASGQDKVMTLVATETQTILVYENTSLKWASQSPFVPMAFKRGTFNVRSFEF